jgi:phosphatidylglycerol:prolipoprotein diacylglycerol transferase
MINFLHTFLPNPIAITLGPIAIHWYGITMMLAILSALGIAVRLGRRVSLRPDTVADVAFLTVLGGLIGARVYAVLLELPFYLAQPFEILAVWHGGLAIHGALIGGGAALWWQVRRRTESLFTWTDIIAPGIALGQAIGRWGNYFNQELFGRPTTLPWGIPIAPNNRPPQYITSTHFQPTFLYESMLNLMSFIILIGLFYYQQQKNKKISAGVVTAIYLVNYGIIRIVMEQFRSDEPPILWGTRWPIVASSVLVIAGASILGYAWLTQRHRSAYNKANKI